MDRISGSVSGIRQNPAIFQLSGIRPDTGYQKIGYPANRILIKNFFLILKNLIFENFGIIHHKSKIAGIRHQPDIPPEIRKNRTSQTIDTFAQIKFSNESFCATKTFETHKIF